MIAKAIRRPWEKQGYGHRATPPEPFYHTSRWKAIRKQHIAGTSIINGKEYSNRLCYACILQGTMTPMHTVDHIQPISEGGSKDDPQNLRSLCLSCHNSKSAKEGNNRRRKS